MYSFYENFLNLCVKAGKSPSRVVLDIGLKKSAVTRWKNGGLPTDATIKRLADYFGVSFQWLKSSDGPESCDSPEKEIPSAPEEDEREKRLMELLRQLPDEAYQRELAYLESQVRLLNGQGGQGN